MDWDSLETTILYNPRLPHYEREAAFKHLPEAGLKEHVWLATSGSTGYIKWVALSKKAILAAAQGANTHINAKASDRWLSCLPSFHIAGLAIQARGYLSAARIFEMESWDPQLYVQLLDLHRITLSSLVPAQVFDLVQKGFQAPQHLRAIIVGGARLQPALYEQARTLGWPLLPSYGMTETGSMIATAANHNDPTFILLPHMQVKATATGHLQIKSPSLFTAYGHLQGEKPRFELRPKPFITEDIGFVDGQRLILEGRDNHFIKIGGESVDLLRLERILEEVKLRLKFTEDAALFPYADPRLGHVIHLATTSTDPDALVANYHELVHPFEKIRGLHYLHLIPRSPIRKLLLRELLEQLNCNFS